MTTVYYRNSLIEKEELDVIKKLFPVTDCIVGIKNDLVIARFSCVPFFKEVEQALQTQNSRMLNSFREHNYIASFDYYYDVEEFTPKTWFNLKDVPKEEAPFIVKGKTTSKKSSWNTMMFAETKEDATRIYCDLQNDYYIGEQGIIIRKYEKFKKLGDSINGLSFINEHRFFFYKTHLLSHGFYWSISDVIGKINQKGIDFAKKIARIISEKTNYFTLDIAETDEGEYRLIEINSGEMSGCSLNNPHELYSNLKTCLVQERFNYQLTNQ